jgi:rubrerythrin
MFQIDEVFEMAVQMEENGAAFYRKAADSTGNQEVKDLLNRLAVMEIEHKATFKKLRSEVVNTKDRDAFFDPQGEGAMYLKAIVDTKVFFEKAIDTSSLEEVLKDAIWAEKDTTVFYLGIRQGMTEEDPKRKIDKIIEEEMSHIRMLSEKLIDLKQQIRGEI